MLRFWMDGASGVPPYLHIVHQVRQSLLLCYLCPGDRLPTVKDVASDLAINPNTVVKAYRQLEHEGLAAGRPGQGTFITGTLSPATPDGHAGLRKSLEAWLRQAEASGLNSAAITALIAVVRQELREEGFNDPGQRGPDGPGAADGAAGQALRTGMGPARLHSLGAGRLGRRSGRTERRRQEAPCCS